MACHECTVNLVSWNITRTSRFKTINENFNAPWDFLLWHQHLLVKTSALNRLYYFRANSFQKQKLPVTDTAGRLILRADLKCSTDFCFKLVAGTYRTETTKHSTSRNSRAKDVLGRNTLWKKKDAHCMTDYITTSRCVHTFCSLCKKRAAKISKLQQREPTSCLPQ